MGKTFILISLLTGIGRITFTPPFISPGPGPVVVLGEEEEEEEEEVIGISELLSACKTLGSS